ncbi:MAG: hypothetical protein PHC91_05125 [Eubacteriales bacterium]|nr:hypothetical protein [Eubacteriales bacterium]
MIYAGIDVAKDKHDCLIVDSDGVIRFQAFTIPNNKLGFSSPPGCLFCHAIIKVLIEPDCISTVHSTFTF